MCRRIAQMSDVILIVTSGYFGEELCNHYCRVLTKAGYKSCAVYSGEQAMALLQQRTFSLVFMESILEDMHGPLLLNYIKRKHPNTPVNRKDEWSSRARSRN